MRGARRGTPRCGSGCSGSPAFCCDQIWFTEKHSDGNTRLYPLSDLDPRKEEAITRRYLAGRYGAVPILSPEDFAAATEPLTSGRITW